MALARHSGPILLHHVSTAAHLHGFLRRYLASTYTPSALYLYAMGSAQSYLPVATIVVAGAAAYGYSHVNKPDAGPEGTSASSSASSSKKQKQKKKAGARAGPASAKEDVPAEPEPGVVSFPAVVPGGFDDAPTPPAEPADRPAKPQKKKKKAKKTSPVPADAQSESSATAPESSAVRKQKKPAGGKQPTLDDAGWTRVETKKRSAKDGAAGDGPADAGALSQSLEITTSDAGITTSATGNSSPVTERTEDESSVLADSGVLENRRTLAERLLPKPRKTGVEECVSSVSGDGCWLSDVAAVACWRSRTTPNSLALCASSQGRTSSLPQGSLGPTTRMSNPTPVVPLTLTTQTARTMVGGGW